MLREGSVEGVANGDGESRRLSPWSSVVCGENSSATASSPVEEDNFLFEGWVDSNGTWNSPPNDPIPSVMGGTASWPELSLSTRPLAIISDGSPQQAPIISQPPQRSVNSLSVNGNHANSTGNNPNPVRRMPKNRGGGGGGGNSSVTGPSQSTFNQPSLPMSSHVPYGKIHAGFDNPGRGSTPIGGFGASQSHSGNDHSSQKSNSRRNNYGPRPRGDGQYHNHGGRRDQDRRDVHQLPQYVPPPMGYMPPLLSPGVSTYMAPPPMRGFPGQIGFDMPPPNFYFPQMAPETFRAMPVHRPTPMVFTPANENPLTYMIINQVDFYFSDDNLARDYFLKSNMDDNGWVPASLIASFRRVQFLTKDIPLILESLRYSMVVEVQGDKVRRRNEWSKWVLSTNISGS